MALKFHASADVRLDIVLTCDESVAEANTPEVLEAYLSEGEDSDLTIPDDATVITIKPLGPREWNVARARYTVPQGVLPPGGVRTDGGAVTAADIGSQMESYLSTLSESEQTEKAAELAAWSFEWNLSLCAMSVQRISDMPDVKPARVSGGRLSEYPREHLETLPAVALQEIAEHVQRVSQLGKANSGR